MGQGPFQQKKVVFLRGGLGNQLFQIQIGLCIQARGAKVVYSDLFLHGAIGRGGSLRQKDYAEIFGLDLFRPRTEAFRTLLRLFFGAFSFLASRTKSTRLRMGAFLSTQNAVSLDSLESISWIDAPGLEEASSPRNLILVSQLVEKQTKKFAVDHSRSFVGVHIRLGDYLQLESIYGRYCYEYLSDALEVIVSHSSPDTIESIVVFSDSEGLVNLPKVPKLGLFDVSFASRFVDGTLQEFRMLMDSRAIVCSNSTFSWWAAALSAAKVITVPHPFLGPERNLPQYQFPDSWIKVARCATC